MYYARRIFAVVALIVLAIAAVYSIRLALADAAFRKHTPQSVERALEILPNHAGYLLFRAQQLDYDGEDSNALLNALLAWFRCLRHLESGSALLRRRAGILRARKSGCWMQREWIISSSRAGPSPIFISAANVEANSGSGCARRWKFRTEIAAWLSTYAGE